MRFETRSRLKTVRPSHEIIVVVELYYILKRIVVGLGCGAAALFTTPIVDF